jgi:solute carrier family 25 protein 34/35
MDVRLGWCIQWCNRSVSGEPVISHQGQNAGKLPASELLYCAAPEFQQAYSPAFPVGAQHFYKSSFDALASVVRKEGARGLVRGIDAAILRTSMGSSVQLPSYNFTKTQLVSRGILPADSTWTFLASSFVSGACVCMAMQPADTALTRMYNQPTKQLPNGKFVGALYANPIDCLWKTFKTEGIRGWYKGTTAHFLRIAPHTIITLTANDLIVNLYKKARHRN